MGLLESFQNLSVKRQTDRLKLAQVDAIDHAVLGHAALESGPAGMLLVLNRVLHACRQRRHHARHPPLRPIPPAATTTTASSRPAAAPAAAAPTPTSASPLALLAPAPTPGLVAVSLVFVVAAGASSGKVDGQGLGTRGAFDVARSCVDEFLHAVDGCE